MAFPTTAVIDNFDRAAEDPLSQVGAWISPMFGSSEPFRTTGSQCEADAVSADAYRATPTGVDCEVYVTVATVGPTGALIFLWLRIQNPGTGGQDDYTLLIERAAGTDIWQFYRGDDLAGTQLGANVLQEVSSGNKVGFEAIGSILAAYRHNGTSWAQLATRTDGTYGAGHIGFGVYDETVPDACRLDDFGGGTVVSAATRVSPFRGKFGFPFRGKFG